MIAVAAGDEIAAKLVYAFVMLEADARLRRVEVVEGDVAHVEYDRSAGSEPRMNQILDHFILCVQHDRAAIGQFRQRNPMTASAKPKLDPVMRSALEQHALADAGLDQQIDRALLQHAGSQRRLDFNAAPRLEHDRFDAGKMQEMREQQSGRPRTDDGDMRAGRRGVRFRLTSCAIPVQAG